MNTHNFLKTPAIAGTALLLSGVVYLFTKASKKNIVTKKNIIKGILETGIGWLVDGYRRNSRSLFFGQAPLSALCISRGSSAGSINKLREALPIAGIHSCPAATTKSASLLATVLY